MHPFVQAAAISKVAAEIIQHNQLLLQLAKSFPANHNGSSVYTWDFGAVLIQARLLCVCWTSLLHLAPGQA